MKTVDDLIRQMSLCRQDAESATRAKIDEILAICEPYRNSGYAFSFTMSGDLDSDVNRILAQLTDLLLDTWQARASELTDDNDAFIFATGDKYGMTTQQRLDRHAAHLKYIVEGWAAVGFVNGLKSRDTAAAVMKYMKNPFGMRMWADALHERHRYASSIIADGDLNRRPGLQNSVIAAITLVGEDIINSAFRYAQIGSIRAAGAGFYGVRRGSAFDCPYCDEICAHIYPVGTCVLPAHPRCMCEPYPVTP